MNQKRYPFSLFLIGFITNILFHFFWLFIPSVILLFIGIWAKGCKNVGLILLGIDIIASFIDQMRIRRAMLSDSENEYFRQFQDAVSKDGNVFENIRDLMENSVGESANEETIQKNQLVMQMWDTICEKCQYGDHIENLNEHERVFFVTQVLAQEVNNGGFSQFFYNSSGDFSNELVEAFTRIGAYKTADICQQALSVFPGPVPVDRDEREELFDHLDCDPFLDECDDAFYEYVDDLEGLNYAYIMAHLESFEK